MITVFECLFNPCSTDLVKYPLCLGAALSQHFASLCRFKTYFACRAQQNQLYGMTGTNLLCSKAIRHDSYTQYHTHTHIHTVTQHCPHKSVQAFKRDANALTYLIPVYHSYYVLGTEAMGSQLCEDQFIRSWHGGHGWITGPSDFL